MSRNAKLREKHEWAIEKPKLDNARRLRGIYFIDPGDMEFKEIIKNARIKLETQWLQPCFARLARTSMGRPVARLMTSSLNLRVSWNPQECVWKNLYRKYHEDHIAGKGDNSLQHYKLVHKFIPMPQAMKIPAAKAAVDKEWEKHEKILAWDLTKVRSKSEVIDEARTKGIKVHFASLMDICHLKNAELETMHQKYKGRVVLRGTL